MTTTFTNGACVYVLIFLQGFFIENLITDSAIYRTKIHSYLLDRVCNKKNASTRIPKLIDAINSYMYMLLSILTSYIVYIANIKMKNPILQIKIVILR